MMRFLLCLSLSLYLILGAFETFNRVRFPAFAEFYLRINTKLSDSQIRNIKLDFSNKVITREWHGALICPVPNVNSILQQHLNIMEAFAKLKLTLPTIDRIDTIDYSLERFENAMRLIKPDIINFERISLLSSTLMHSTSFEKNRQLFDLTIRSAALLLKDALVISEFADTAEKRQRVISIVERVHLPNLKAISSVNVVNFAETISLLPPCYQYKGVPKGDVKVFDEAEQLASIKSIIAKYRSVPLFMVDRLSRGLDWLRSLAKFTNWKMAIMGKDSLQTVDTIEAFYKYTTESPSIGITPITYKFPQLARVERPEKANVIGMPTANAFLASSFPSTIYPRILLDAFDNFCLAETSALCAVTIRTQIMSLEWSVHDASMSTLNAFDWSKFKGYTVPILRDIGAESASQCFYARLMVVIMMELLSKAYNEFGIQGRILISETLSFSHLSTIIPLRLAENGVLYAYPDYYEKDDLISYEKLIQKLISELWIVDKECRGEKCDPLIQLLMRRLSMLVKWNGFWPTGASKNN